MKKKLFLIAGLLAVAVTLNAQQRLVLYEEFTGENCPPCAATNPGLWSLMTSGNNESKIIMIKYQSPIPSAGTIYREDKVDVDARMAYYRVPFAPYGRMDGAISPTPDGQPYPGHAGYMKQAYIDTEAAVAAPFAIDIASFSTADGKVNATVHITANDAVHGGNLKLRAALVETLNFTKAPGRNGEKVFENVVRKMYPDASGQALSTNTWTSGQTQTVTITGAIPDYVDLKNEHALVVWIQDDSDKNIQQTAIASQPAGINEAVQNGGFNIYPNPANDHVTVDLNMLKPAKVTLSIISLPGRQISSMEKELSVGTNKIAVATRSLAPGVYYLKVISKEGILLQKKFVKE